MVLTSNGRVLGDFHLNLFSLHSRFQLRVNYRPTILFLSLGVIFNLFRLHKDLNSTLGLVIDVGKPNTLANIV